MLLAKLLYILVLRAFLGIKKGYILIIKPLKALLLLIRLLNILVS